jgi:hypothetical protein
MAVVGGATELVKGVSSDLVTGDSIATLVVVVFE